MTPLVSVVVPARNAAATLEDCLRALEGQSLDRGAYELIVVDGRSEDATQEIAARARVTLVTQEGTGAAGARNDGIRAARGDLVAFTDADCVASRGWLRALVDAVGGGADPTILGAAGPTIGFRSETAAAHFVDLTGGLQAERHLAHPRYPWAPTTNVLYRRAALLAVGGFDARFGWYEGCDLHTRLVRHVGGEFRFAPRAVVLHRHRAGWAAYREQQRNYGRGYAQFFLRYADELAWSAGDELGAWLRVGAAGIDALRPAPAQTQLLRRGTFMKQISHRAGFAATYWSRTERARWRTPAVLLAAAIG